MQIPFRLIKVDHKLLKWLRGLPIWGDIREMVMSNSKYLSLEVEHIIQERLLDTDTRCLLKTLLHDMNGIPLEELGIKLEEWDEVKKAKCASSRLVDWGLAHVGKSTGELKASNLAFDPRVLFLTDMEDSFPSKFIS